MGASVSSCCANAEEQPEQQIAAHLRDSAPGLGSMPGLEEPAAVRAQQQSTRQESEAAATAESQGRDFQLPPEEVPGVVPQPAKEAEPMTPPPAANEPEYYQFTIDRSSGGKLGIDVDHEDNRTLLVESISGGLVGDWNIANPLLQVRVGDRIVEVNGLKDDVMKMVEECKKLQLLECRVEKGRRHWQTAP